MAYAETDTFPFDCKITFFLSHRATYNKKSRSPHTVRNVISPYFAALGGGKPECNYQVTLMPSAMLALELSGMNSLLVLPRMWSMPMKKL